MELLTFVLPRHLGLAYIELRCTYSGRSLVHAIAFIARGRIPRDTRGRKVDDIFLPPDLVIEIISPGQTVKNMSARLSWCVRHGVRLGWFIRPRQSQVLVFRPECEVEILGPGDVLAGEGVLPGFALPLEEMFGWLEKD